MYRNPQTAKNTKEGQENRNALKSVFDSFPPMTDSGELKIDPSTKSDLYVSMRKFVVP